MTSPLLSPKLLVLGLVIFTVFTVSLTENLQMVEGFSAVANKVIYELESGEADVQTWKVINDSDEKIWVEFYARGSGSEFLTFEKIISFEPRHNKLVEIIVSIPDDHPNDIEYRPTLIALMRGDPVHEGINGAQVNIELRKTISIKIGDNPVYTIPEKVEPKITPPAVVIPEKEAYEEAKETLAEKMARINAANEARVAVMGETPAEATGQFEVEDPVPDFEPGPQADPEALFEINPVGTFIEEPVAQEEGGGCLIATATFGSELAPQVQLLREIRDNQLMNTGSGMAFMSGFNSLYYSFSPVIADMERESPAFKELVKLAITPMISSLSVMEYAESESEVLGLGIGVILMNLGMYVGLPTFGIFKLIQLRRN